MRLHVTYDTSVEDNIYCIEVSKAKRWGWSGLSGIKAATKFCTG